MFISKSMGGLDGFKWNREVRLKKQDIEAINTHNQIIWAKRKELDKNRFVFCQC